MSIIHEIQGPTGAEAIITTTDHTVMNGDPNTATWTSTGPQWADPSKKSIILSDGKKEVEITIDQVSDLLTLVDVIKDLPDDNELKRLFTTSTLQKKIQEG